MRVVLSCRVTLQTLAFFGGDSGEEGGEGREEGGGSTELSLA